MKVYLVEYLESVFASRWIIVKAFQDKEKAEKLKNEFVQRWDRDHHIRPDEHGNTGKHYYFVRTLEVE